MQMQDIRGKIAVVTGASSGIGEAAARLLHQEGLEVVVCARRADQLAKLADELKERVYPVTADVGDPRQVAALFAEVQRRFHGLDLLFNNAGVGFYASFADSQPDEWRQTIDANLYGVLNCTHAAIPLLRNRPGAMISTVSSVGGRYGLPGWSVYNATKFAVVGFHDALRKELGPEGIRVALIEPGAVWTHWGYNVPTEQMTARRESLDALHAEDIAQALVYSFAQPPRVLVEEILVRPVRQISP
ncbi:SDR family oxidoreductase [Acidiferrobacter sp.]|uniref:SDR family oxidoreductase n=1 Tax=Acidiferrobacter sp. TaxID=1872107 RepID=UPI002610D90E|nr:SDR family oxidoreductase [Acidiferrobacter sp.]